MQPDCSYNALAWGSHLAPLIGAVASSKGPVIEIGIGHFSTPILHGLCKALHRNLVSLEQDVKWFEMFASQYGDEGHKFVLVEIAGRRTLCP